MTRLSAVPLQLSYFITKARVRAQYRAFLRGSKGLESRGDTNMATDIRARVKEAFRADPDADDFSIRQKLAAGERDLKLLRALAEEQKPDDVAHVVWPWQE